MLDSNYLSFQRIEQDDAQTQRPYEEVRLVHWALGLIIAAIERVPASQQIENLSEHRFVPLFEA
jgi:hypothetical protein